MGREEGVQIKSAKLASKVLSGRSLRAVGVPGGNGVLPLRWSWYGDRSPH